MKRTLAAVAIMLGLSLAVGELLDVPPQIGWWLQPVLSGFLGAAIGGFIARRRFVPVALVIHALVWLLILYILHAIANGQASYIAIANTNLGAMALSFALVALGAWAGQRAAQWSVARAAVANA